MSGKTAPKIELTLEERETLNQITRKHLASQRLVHRARIILLADEGITYRETARILKTNRHAVTKWRTRWLENKNLKCLNRLQDAVRPGVAATFTPEQICQIVAIACEKPEQSQRPISHWTPREVADEAKRRKIVATISERQVGRFLKRSGSQATSVQTMDDTSTR